MAKIIEARNLTRNYGNRKAVDNLSFDVEEGEVIGLLGPNGAGKTTTIRMLAGIIKPTSGSATVAGFDIPGDDDDLHQKIGLLTEIPGFYDRLSANYNLGYFASFYDGIDIPKQIKKYLDLMGLYERRNDKVGTLSKGLKQKLALARALLHEPQILFLDEPTSGLDPEAARQVRDLVKQLGREGRTIFLSTHNLAEAEQLCDRIAVIRTELLVLNTVENLRKEFSRREVVICLQNPDAPIFKIMKNIPFVIGLRKEDEKIIAELDDSGSGIPEVVQFIVKNGGQIKEIYENKQSLEEMYLKLVEKNPETSEK